MRPTFQPPEPRPSATAEAAHQLRRHLQALVDSYSEVLFLKGWKLGGAILSITLLAPNVALAGMVAVLAAYAFARFIRMGPVVLESGFYTYNPLLVGLSLGYLFRLTPLTLFFVVTAGITALVLTHGLFSAAWYYLRLPVLSLPFVVVSSLAYLAAGSYTNLYVDSLYPKSVAAVETLLPLWLGGFLRSMGAVFFVPSAVAGALIAAALLVRSRILFLLAVGGYYAGTLTLAALGSGGQAFTNLNAFNFILIAMALGGVFMVPSLTSYVLAFIAVVTSTLFLSSAEVFWSRWGVPVLALPFNLVTLGFLYALKLVEHPMLARGSGTPEEVLDEHLTQDLRFPGSLRSLGLPFAGRWTVWQAFDGPWTHQGPWRHAYDFVVTDARGETHRGDGGRVEDYLAFRKPVLAPIKGRVVHVVDAHPDNPIGSTDRANNWGNLVVLKDERGFFAEISHFAQGSIRVREGEWVERGALLGLCGNSGYSPQPHIHLQVQATEQVGAPTLPFSFVSYQAGGTFHANDAPPPGTLVETLPVETALENRMGFLLDEVYRFRVEGCDRARFPGSREGTMELTVRMAPDGTFFLDSGRGRLYFGTRDGTFFFYRMEGNDPCLRAVFLALPRMPLAYRRGLRWSDHVPAGTVTWGVRRGLVRLARSVAPRLGTVSVDLEFVDERRIVGRVRSGLLMREWETQVVLHPFRGFQSVRVGDLRMERVDDGTE
ncbi:MAG: peptidase M23 [Gemmatimonadetes bacterium]|nr:peptidase M23 [Gemmatimonadota bacterium]